jgi:hypothetical protein
MIEFVGFCSVAAQGLSSVSKVLKESSTVAADLLIYHGLPLLVSVVTAIGA